MFCIMDSCPAASLPPGVSDTRLPDWLLPHVPPAERARFRPISFSSLASLTTEQLFLLHSASTLSQLLALERSLSSPSTKRGRSGRPLPPPRPCAPGHAGLPPSHSSFRRLYAVVVPYRLSISAFAMITTLPSYTPPSRPSMRL